MSSRMPQLDLDNDNQSYVVSVRLQDGNTSSSDPSPHITIAHVSPRKVKRFTDIESALAYLRSRFQAVFRRH